MLAFALNPGLVRVMFSPSLFTATLREKALPAGLWEVERCLRGTALLSQGEASDEVLVLTSGLVKLTYATASGDEWIKSFIMDAGVFGGLDGAKSRFGAVTLEASDVTRLPASWVKRIVAEDAQVAERSAEFSQWLLARKQQREESLLCDPVEVRYRRMLDEEADLVARLSQGDIARYLRVTPIAFSRIKRRLGSPRVPARPLAPTRV
jgi:CRP-like cAMP-binding protein